MSILCITRQAKAGITACQWKMYITMHENSHNYFSMNKWKHQAQPQKSGWNDIISWRNWGKLWEATVMAATKITNSNVCPEHFWYTGSISEFREKDADSVSQPILLFALNDNQIMHPFCTNPPQDHLSLGQGLKEFKSKKHKCKP